MSISFYPVIIKNGSVGKIEAYFKRNEIKLMKMKVNKVEKKLKTKIKPSLILDFPPPI